MPNWKTHIEISKELNKTLKYNKEDYDLFVFGSILPDVNNGHLVKDVSKVIDHSLTHFVQEGKKNYEVFYNEYKDQINNPLVFGYFTHLFTDYTWNHDFHNKIIKESIEEDYLIRTKNKQSDFKVYNNKFMDNTIDIDNIKKIQEETKNIKEISVTKEDIIKVKEFLDTQDEHKEELHYYSIEEMEELKNYTINELKDYIKTD